MRERMVVCFFDIKKLFFLQAKKIVEHRTILQQQNEMTCAARK